jgi:hypothetical protein
MKSIARYAATGAVALAFALPLMWTSAFAVSKAMQSCEAEWDAYVRKLPAAPRNGVKAKFIKDCMAHASTTATTTNTSTHGTVGPAVTTDPPDPEKTTHTAPEPGH